MPENEAVNHTDTDVMEDMKEKLHAYTYYILIFVLSVIALTFLPTIGSDGELALKLPITAAGWTLYIFTKFAGSLLNLLIFWCFNEQGRSNIRNNPNYIRANEILMRINNKIRLPRSPRKWLSQQYGRKGTLIVISSLLGMFCIANAVLKWDWAALCSYAVTITMGIIFGIIQMHRAELYWTTEYLSYAILKEEEINERSIEECPGTGATELERHPVSEGNGNDSKPEH